MGLRQHPGFKVTILDILHLGGRLNEAYGPQFIVVLQVMSLVGMGEL
jgi:hypothetical protein